MEMVFANSAAVGRWCFRHRSFAPLPLLALLLTVGPDFGLTVPVLGAAFLCILGAESLRLWAVSYAGSATRTRSDDVPRLVTAGPYRFTRNPLYMANIVLYVSFFVLFGHFYLTLFAAAYFVFQYSFIIAYEEVILEATFDTRYVSYRNSVPRWLWNKRGYGPSNADVHPDFPAAIRSERSTFMALAAMSVLWATRFLWR
jgi:protein-S-isoprenylcysteine O-methyltransferase Ste14